MLTDKTLSELVGIYNVAATALGEKEVKKFSDKKSAIRRTTAIHEKLAASLPSADEPKEVADEPKKVVERRKRQKRFFFKPDAEIRRPSSKTGNTLRDRCVNMLAGGAFFKQVEDLCADFDKERGKEPANLERRAYELVRIMHYDFGFGLLQDDRGQIFIYDNEDNI